MALTRKLLKGMGITDEQIDTIIDAHTETVDGLKAQIDEYKTAAESADEIQKELDQAKADLQAEKKESWKVKYDALKEEYDDYKSAIESRQTHAEKESAYRDLLKEAGVSDKRIDAVLKVSDVDSVELDKDGNVVSAAEILSQIKDEWSDFIQTASAKGADTPTPPQNAGGNTLSREEIMKIPDREERRRKIAENLDLFSPQNPTTQNSEKGAE
ncbi:MAG: phage scaffolding protein [Clostridia bacterium]|nr:phage scaffolding protein [Clostridia bacterium]